MKWCGVLIFISLAIIFKIRMGYVTDEILLHAYASHGSKWLLLSYDLNDLFLSASPSNEIKDKVLAEKRQGADAGNSSSWRQIYNKSILFHKN